MKLFGGPYNAGCWSGGEWIDFCPGHAIYSPNNQTRRHLPACDARMLWGCVHEDGRRLLQDRRQRQSHLLDGWKLLPEALDRAGQLNARDGWNGRNEYGQMSSTTRRPGRYPFLFPNCIQFFGR